MKKWIFISLGVAAVTAVVLYILLGTIKSDGIIIPYIAHQKPMIDPHQPTSDALSDKLDDLQFDGIFNVTSDASGLVYEDALGSLVSIDTSLNIITIKLNTSKKWHDSYKVIMKEEELKKIDDNTAHYFSAKDLRFTLDRIKNLGSLSPDYILISQALESEDFVFEGPDANDNVKFKLKSSRYWVPDDLKLVFSFKLLPANADEKAISYAIGTSNYLAYQQKTGVSNYHRTPEGVANISNVMLSPFIDNSTFITELKNGKINVLLNTPFGALSPLLEEKKSFFAKPSISSVFFSVLFNTERLSREERKAVRSILNNKKIVERFFKAGTPQQRHIIDYKDKKDNYESLLNFSVFPSSTVYVEDSVVIEKQKKREVNLNVLRDTIRIAVCLNYGYREELSELSEILNDPNVTGGKIKVRSVQNEDLIRGDYDAVLIAFSGYKSTDLFDLYNVFLREPNLEIFKINLNTSADDKPGKMKASYTSFKRGNNFFRIDPAKNLSEGDDIMQLLKYIYGFMSTRSSGDKRVYAKKTDELEQEMCLGAWLFSLPSLAYFNAQFDPNSINLFGVANQLSTISKWKEKPKK